MNPESAIIFLIFTVFTVINMEVFYAFTTNCCLCFPLPDYQLKLTFDNGEKKLFDVKPYIIGSWYGELKDPELFGTVTANGYSVEWKNGQDICPDDLYYNSTSLTDPS